uniref:FHA domain-containing protein n=1 Tax=Callorhinchus milii TaxID=7868 RepID=A0A4W3H203_CALMI
MRVRVCPEFPVYRGDNVIGRHESCGVRLAAQSVSKRHAVIEVDDDGHLIYDCNSLNKTRRVRRVLKPGVRYALPNPGPNSKLRQTQLSLKGTIP